MSCVAAESDLRTDPNFDQNLSNNISDKSPSVLNQNNTHKTNKNTSPNSFDEIPLAAGSPKFTNQQVINAAVQLKTDIERNHTLPETIKVNGININIYAFYYLLSTVVQNLNSKNPSSVDVMSFKGPQIQKEDIRSGNMRLSELIHIADVVKVYMDRTGITPGYAYQTSLGTYMRWQTLLYTYCNVLDSYNHTKNLPATVGVKPWKVLSDPNARSFTNQQVVNAAILLKTNIETNHTLPNTVLVDGFSVNIYTFYYLLSTVVQNLNTKNNNPIDAMSFNGPQVVKEEIHMGAMFKSEYIGIADVVKVYMDRTGIVPGYAYSTSVGTYLSYKSLICAYCNVLSSYNSTKNLPASVGVKPWKVFSVDEILDAASWVKMAVEKTHKLPDSMTISGSYVSMPSLLEILTTTLLRINGTSAPIYLNTCGSPQVTRDEITTGKLYKDEYLKIAGDVKSYMDSSWIAPGYAYNTGVGLYCGYHNLIYTYSQILDYYNTNNNLPNSITVKPWYIVSKSYKINIVVSGTGGVVTDNYLINVNIPYTTASYEIVNAAKQGTPMITMGDGNGQKVMIVAGVHGNEVPATIAAMDLINYLNGKSIHGTLYIIPFVIPHNSATTSRYWQGQNPNSVSNIPGTPTNQILNLARNLKVDALGDFHSTQPGGVPGRNAAMYSQNPTYESYVLASYISSHTGSALIGAYQAGVDYPGALEDVSNLAGIPAVTCEVLSSHGTVASGSIGTSFNQIMAFLSYHNLV